MSCKYEDQRAEAQNPWMNELGVTTICITSACNRWRPTLHGKLTSHARIDLFMWRDEDTRHPMSTLTSTCKYIHPYICAHTEANMHIYMCAPHIHTHTHQREKNSE